MFTLQEKILNPTREFLRAEPSEFTSPPCNYLPVFLEDSIEEDLRKTVVYSGFESCFDRLI